MNLTLALQIAKIVIFVLLSIKDLVLYAEQQFPEAGRGAEKLAAVKGAVVGAAKLAGFAEQAIASALGYVDLDKRINDVVAKEINNK